MLRKVCYNNKQWIRKILYTTQRNEDSIQKRENAKQAILNYYFIYEISFLIFSNFGLIVNTQ